MELLHTGIDENSPKALMQILHLNIQCNSTEWKKCKSMFTAVNAQKPNETIYFQLVTDVAHT